jgi:hypothetical protein
MSTGPEHYRQAEVLADRAQHFTYGDGANPTVGAALAAEAQVHATLALVAVQADLLLLAHTDASVETLGRADEWAETVR